jgi:hypothetical protein
MKITFMWACFIFAFIGGMFAQNQPEKLKVPVPDVQNLIGTWRVVEFADLDKAGKWVYWFGEHPKGYFVYDATGHVHI